MSKDLLARVRSFGLPAYGDDEVRFVSKLLEQYRPTHIFEWGTNVGASARLFYEASLELDLDYEIHTVELPLELAHLDRDHPGLERYAQWIQGLPIHCHRGDGLSISLDLLGELDPERPFFFLDGNHDHDAVLNELTHVSVAHPGALLLIHDTKNLTGDVVREFSASHPNYELREVRSDAGMICLWPPA